MVAVRCGFKTFILPLSHLMIIQMGDVYALSPFLPIFIVKSVQGGGGFSSGHKWGILGGRQGPVPMWLDI
jgi:hypothetical protein